jgi:hypothetical protein
MRPSPGVIFCISLGSLLLPLVPMTPKAAETTLHVTRRYDAGRLALSAGPSGVATALDGLRTLERPGRPALPVDRVTVEAPAGMRLADVGVHVSGTTRVAVGGTPAAYRPQSPPGGSPVVPDPSVYGGTAPFPAETAEILPGGYFRGRRMETVEVHPVRWLPAEGSLVVAERVDLDLRFEPDDTPGRLRPRRIAWEPTDRFAEAAAGLETVPHPRVAPERRGTVAPQMNGGEPFSPRFLPSEDGSPVRYLIITSDPMAAAMQGLADWKTALGIPTVVRTTSWIYANYPRGVDHAEDVRNFIREAVEKWGVEYVLMAGDLGEVPVRYGKSYYYTGDLIPTDLYFMCLDGNWDANGDDLFGQAYVNSTVRGDGADLYPDVWEGRLPVRDATEAQDYVAKVKRYETQAPLGPGFGDEGLLLGEMLIPQNWSQGDTVLFDGAEVCQNAEGHMSPVVTNYRMYENYTQYTGAHWEYRPDVISQLRHGYNVILHVGHGYRNTMAVGYQGMSLGNADADALTNGARQGLLYAINCTSSAFDFDCIADHFIRNPDGGVVASVGSTRYDFPATGRYYQDEFFSQVYDSGVTRLGEAAALQKLPFVSQSSKDGEDRWTQFNLIYMGDPTLDLYTGPVDTLTATLTTPLVLGQTSYTVQISDSSGPVEGATVCLNEAGDSYGYAVTDASGQAVIPFDPDLPGPATLGVRAHDYHSRVDTVEVAAPVGLHLFAQGVEIDDSTGGDGNGTLEAGETAYLYPVIGNQGDATATGVSVTVAGSPAGIGVLDNSASCPEVLPDSTATCTDPLEVSIAPTAGDVSLETLDLHVTATGYSRDFPLILYVGAPQVIVTRSAWRDTVGNGNGDGVVQAGEDQFFRVTLENQGLGVASGLTASLTSTDPAVQILDGTSGYGDVEPDSSASGDGFLFQFSDSDPTHPMHLTVTDQGGVVLERDVDIVAPGSPVGLTSKGGATGIELRWFPVTSADLAGYDVYRAVDASGPFSRINPVPTERISYYRDEDLPPLTRFYYKVASVDSSGNVSATSPVTQATTSLPEAPGFPLALGAATSSSPCLAYLSGDTLAEVVTGADEVYAVQYDGKELMDGDHDTRTYGVFSSTGFGPFWTPPAVGDLDHDGVEEIVAAGWSSGFLYVWESHGEVRSGWPRPINIDGLAAPAIWGAPVLADLDGDGHLEVLINAGRYTFAFHDDGTEVADGDNDPATTGVLIKMGSVSNFSTPAVADLDNDGTPEVIVGSRDGKLYVVEPDGSPVPGFPFVTGGDITCSPAIGDLDRDGLPEIVFANGNLQVFALNINLQQPPGWPVGANMNRDYDASPALADMDGDGYLDVVLCAGNGTPFMWHGQNGHLFPGWGFVLYDSEGNKLGLSSSPAVGNLDDDPDLEVCFGANDGNVYAYNVDATLVRGFPIGTANRIEGGPLLWDIDGDGYTEVVVHDLDQNLYIWKSPGDFDPQNQPWPMFHHDSHRTGVATSPIWVVTGVPAGEPPTLHPVLSPNFPNPFSSSTRIEYRVPASASGGEAVTLSIYDLSGREVRTLVHGFQPAGAYTASWDGTDAAGRPVTAGIYFYRLRAGKETLTRKLVRIP